MNARRTNHIEYPALEMIFAVATINPARNAR
jgi:hypothetical protein